MQNLFSCARMRIVAGSRSLGHLAFFLISLFQTAVFFGQGTYTFSYTGSFQTFTVPNNVVYLTCTLTGASGGGAAGLGAQYIRTVAVTPGQILRIYVGGQGVTGSYASGGFNGGGTAGGAYSNEGSGGGATDIRVSPYTLADRILVAGGGGGGGGWAGGSGGGGGLVGIAGVNGQGYGGGGGTSSSGGAGGAGNGCGNGSAGSLGQGGAGGSCSYGGGGGGGGYYGGGGGGADNNSCCADGAGGGGGSSFPASGGTCTSGFNSGNGLAVITASASLGVFAIVAPITCNGANNAVLTATVLGGTPPYTYTWLPSGATTQSIVGVGPGTYTIRSTDNNSVIYTNTVVVTNPPVFMSTVASQKSVTCFGASNGSANISVTGGVAPYSYTWSPYGGNNNFALGLPGGEYFVDIADANGCTNQATVSIQQPPALQIVAFVSSQTVCAGQAVTFIGAGASSYSWSGGVINGVPFAPSATASYVVTGLNAQGCTGSAYTTVSVIPSPTIAMTGSAQICFGNTATLSASGANSYTWNGGVTGSTVTVSPSVNTIYTVSGTNSLGCSSSASTLLVVYSLPNVVVLPTATSVCIGQPVTLYASGANSYTWAGGVSGGVAFSPTASGGYTVTGANSYGCLKSATTSVVVRQLPLVTATGPFSICAGTNTQLVASGALYYSWGSAGSGATVNVAPTVNTTYTVNGTDANGCSSSATVPVTVNALPVLNAYTSSTLVCQGSVVNLLATGAVTYTWNPGGQAGAAPSVTPSTTTIYTVSGADANQCVGNNTVGIVVQPAPSLSLSAPSQICAGTQAMLSASGAQTYIWSTNAVSSIIFVGPLTTSVYWVTGLGSNGCAKTITHTLLVNPVPALNPFSSNPKFCIGQTATLTAGGAFTYTWMPGNITAQSMTISPTSAFVYTVSGTGTGGCKSTSLFPVSVYQLPSVSISGTSTLCSGHEQILTGKGAQTYTWNAAINSPTIAVSPTVPTTYSVSGTDINGCVNKATFSVSILPSPLISGSIPADTACIGEPVVLSASGGLNYLWSTSDTTAIITVFPAAAETYTVWSYGSNGCNTKVLLAPNVDECTAISVQERPTTFKIYPNPSNGEFYVTSDRSLTLRIADIAGKVLRVVTISGTEKISLGDIPRGVYFVTTVHENYAITEKLIIQ